MKYFFEREGMVCLTNAPCAHLPFGEGFILAVKATGQFLILYNFLQIWPESVKYVAMASHWTHWTGADRVYIGRN